MVQGSGLKSEPQNIEQEISNDEVWNHCAQSFLKIIMIVRHKSSRQVEYLTSIFAIPCSTFDILLSEFLFRLDRPFFLAGGGPDTCNLTLET